MRTEAGTFDTPNAKQIGLEEIVRRMAAAGVRRLFVKKLSPNDNSKNQPYFGHHLTDLPFIPTGAMQASDTSSRKTHDPSRQIKYHASINLNWIDADGNTYRAPNAKLIYYPQYPEVRFSGFLKGSSVNASRWMAPDREGRAPNRWLLLGVAEDRTVYAFLATPDSHLAKELESTKFINTSGVFGEVDMAHIGVPIDTQAALLKKLREINGLGWINGRKLGADMSVMPYKARNGAGYTLEALLGIPPNGVAEPDYLGWEVKQFGVKEFPAKSPKPTTLMTPEPNGGIYITDGAAEFVRRFGYPDKSGTPDRVNFGGRHLAGVRCETTKLTLFLDGFDQESGRIVRATGTISLISENGLIAASWTFAKIMDHWKKKHAKAVYVPCQMRGSGSEYRFGSEVKLGIGTNFEMLLSSMASGHVYYDPGIKLERASTAKPRLKRRSQFRVNHRNLKALYKRLEMVDVSG